MRAVKIILIIFFVILAALIIAGVVFIKTFDINRYKPQIVTAAQSQLGRTFDFTSIDLNISLAKGINIVISDIVLGEDPQFGSGDFLKVQQVSLGVDILSYLLKKQVSITKAQVKSPHVTIIRSKDGLINAQTIAAGAENVSSASGGAGTARQSGAPSQDMTDIALPAIFADAFEVSGGEVIFIDHTFEPALQLELKQLALGVTGFSLDTPFPFYVAGSVFGQEENFRVEGRARVDAKTFGVTLSQVKSATDLRQFSLKEIAALPLIPPETPFPEILEGKLTVTVKDLTAGPEGMGPLRADITWEEGKVLIREAAPGVSFAASRIKANILDFSLDQAFQWNASAAYLSDTPNISLNGKATLDLNAQSVALLDMHIETDLSSLSLDELKHTVEAFKDVPLPQRMSGKVGMDIKEIGLSPQGLDSLRLNMSLTNGEVDMKDLAPGVSLDAKRIKLEVNDFSLDKPFAFHGEAALYSDQPNIFFDGAGTFDLETQEVSLTNTKIRNDLTSLSMARLKDSMEALKDVPLPETLQGLASVQIDSLSAGPAGLIALNGITELKGGRMKLKELALPLENIDAKITMTTDKITLPEMAVKMGQGNFKVGGDVDQYLTQQIYQGQFDLAGLQIFELIDQKDAPVKAHGLINGAFKINGQGFDPDKMAQTLKGSGSLEITEGKLTDINILKMVLDKLTFIPNLRQMVEAGLPERFKEKLQQKDTILTKVRIDLGIDQGTVLIQPLNVEADGFVFTGTGRADLDSSFNFDGFFIIPRDLASGMAKAVPEMEYLFDETGQIRFPLKVSGKGADIKVFPDVKNVTTNAIKNKGREELEKALDKVFDRKQPAAAQPAPTTDGSQGAPAQPQKAPEQILIEGVLDRIFK